MNDINWSLSNKFRSHWVKVKFYKEKPNLKEAKRLKGVKFCEATREAIIHPILLDKESISCSSAQYVFGWRSDYKKGLLEGCQEKRKTQEGIVESMLSRIPYLKGLFNYIGLNTEGKPDLVMSYMVPEEAMRLIKIYHNYKGGNLDVSLCSMMSVCGGIVVRTFLEKDISLSFGCDDSRRYADMRREYLAVGIPEKLFRIFID